MADFNATRHPATDFNNGIRYNNGDGVRPSEFNALVENALYYIAAVESLISNPDSSEAGIVGTPKVELIPNQDASIPDGKKFKFSNLRGATFFPKIENGVISWTNDGGLKNPTAADVNGNSVWVKYRVDENSYMYDSPSDRMREIGFYIGKSASSQASDYKWSKFVASKQLVSSEPDGGYPSASYNSLIEKLGAETEYYYHSDDFPGNSLVAGDVVLFSFRVIDRDNTLACITVKVTKTIGQYEQGFLLNGVAIGISIAGKDGQGGGSGAGVSKNEIIDRSGNVENADSDSSDFVQSNDLSIRAKIKTSDESFSIKSLAGKFSTGGKKVSLTGGVASCVDIGDYICIIGGQTTESGAMLVGTQKIIKYSKQDDSFSQIGSWKNNRGYCGVAYVPKDNSVYIIGGSESYYDSSSDTAVINIIDYKIYKINVSTNILTESQYSIPSSISPIYCYAYYRDLDSSIYCVSSDGSYITKFNVNTGAIDNIDISSLITPNHTNVSACCVNDKIYIFSKETSVLVYEFDLSNASARQINIDNVVFSHALCASSGNIHIFVGDNTYVFDTNSYSIKELSNSGYSSIDAEYTICVSDYLFFIDDSLRYSALLASRKSATYEYREISTGSSTPIIDLGAVTLTEQELGGIKMAYVDGIQITLEQATLAQADNPPIVKIRFNNDDHEFYRTKISTDASAAYIYFAATEDMGEGAKFYNLQITVSESGGANAMLLVWEYNLVDGILNEFDIGTLTFTEDTATRIVTDDEWPLVQSANVMTFRIFDSSSGVEEHFKMYLTHYLAGESNPDEVNLYNRSYFGVVTTQSGTPYGYSAVYDSENKRIIVTKVSLNSGGGSSYTLPIASETVLGGVQPVAKTTEMTQEVGVDKTGKLWTTPTSGGSGGSGLAQNEIINREASIAIADENSPDFVENNGDLWVKRLLGYKAKVNTLEATLPSVEDCTSAATAPNGKIYVFGGSFFGGYSDDILEFDPVTKSVTTLEATLPRGSYDTSAATAPNGKIYVFGGISSGDTSQYFLDDILEFDPVAQTVTTLEATLPSGRAETSAATAPNGKIYVFGGYDANSGSYLDDIIEFDPVTQSVTTLSATLPSVRDDTSAATAPNGKIYVFGGVLGSGRYLDDILEFDPVTQTVTTLEATLPSTRFGTSASTAPNGKIYVFGGAFGDRLDDILEFDPVTKSVTTLEATLPRGSYDTSAATAPNGKIYVFKGNSIGVGDFSDDILEFDPSVAQYTYSPAVVLSQEEYAQFKNILNGIFSGRISAPSAEISGEIIATGAVTASSFNTTT